MSLWLGGYRAASALLPLAAPALLRRRLARGKEDPARWREKLGAPSRPRPDGRLVWMHAVGLGEVLALRGLIAAMAARDPALCFLVTSTARSSAQVMAANLPPRTVHQFLPLDAPQYLARFLNHWRPALSVWAEQDLWPGAVAAAAARGVPLALVNARMNAAAFARRRRAAGLFRALLGQFALVVAQDDATARHLTALGARGVQVLPSLKSAAPPLACNDAHLARLRTALAGRRVWTAVSTHAADEGVALAAHLTVLARDPGACLILAPRVPDRAPDILRVAQGFGLAVARRSAGQGPGAGVYLADTFGELGLWYRLAPAALVGGGFGVGGHNPWEAAALGCAVLHGPGVANFATDYAAFHAAAAARAVQDSAELAAALDDAALPAMAARGHALWQRGRGQVDGLAERLCAMVAG
jgi:3-deoxy-D-manno-octulosonic-acid transferase